MKNVKRNWTVHLNGWYMIAAAVVGGMATTGVLLKPSGRTPVIAGTTPAIKSALITNYATVVERQDKRAADGIWKQVEAAGYAEDPEFLELRGDLWLSLAEFSQAEDCYRRVVAKSRHHGVIAKLAVTVLRKPNSITVVKDTQEAFDLANESLRKAREAGDRHGTADAMLTLGNALLAKGDLPKAITFLNSARVIYSEIGRDALSSLSDVLNSLAVAYELSGDADRASDLHKESTTVLEQAMPGNNIAKAVFIANNAKAEKAASRFRESLKMSVTAKEMAEAHLNAAGLPLTDLRLAFINNNLAQTYSALGMPNDAIKCADAAVRAYQTELGDIHPTLEIARGVLADTIIQAGRVDRYDEAQQQALKSLKNLQTINHGVDDEHVAAAANVAAVVVDTAARNGVPVTGDLDIEVERLYKVATEMYARLYPDGVPLSATIAFRNYGTWLAVKGQKIGDKSGGALIQRGIAMIELAERDMSRSQTGKPTLERADCLYVLANAHKRLNQFERAGELATNAAEMYRKVFGGDSAKEALCRALWAWCLFKQGSKVDTIVLAKDACEMAERVRAPADILKACRKVLETIEGATILTGK